ncbi:MAG: hypothetical protein M3162_05275 [Thermoproteota archaeon]|nr:hypothetical protein [Thermoproteota archaeon]
MILAPLVIINSAFAQPFSSNKESKAEKCASGALPAPACKNVDNRGQSNDGGTGTGQTAGGGGSGTGATGATGGSNTANPAISQSQQSTQLCASGNIKVLPHSSITCTNTANLGQSNNGSISTGQTAGGGGGGTANQ